MDKQSIREIVIETVAKELEMEPAEITDTVGIANNLAWDSMAHLNIFMNLEKQLGCTMDLMEVSAVQTVSDWINLCEKTTLK